MPTHNSVAKSSRLTKEKYPDRYCADSRCLWRLKGANGEFVSYCRNHPHLNPEAREAMTNAR